MNVTPVTAEELLEDIGAAVAGGHRLTVLAHNLHSVYLFHTDEEFRQSYAQAEVVVVDGMPVLAALSMQRLASGRLPLSASRRIGSTDWIRSAVQLPSVERVALLGASPESNRAAAEVLQEGTSTRFLTIPGDPWNHDDVPHVAEQIAEFAPQLLLVGAGMPLQERIASELRDRTDVPVMATVGGAFDQISGKQALAPRWLGRSGFEWAWRLAADPRRLADRYLVEPLRLSTVLLRRA